MAIGPTRAIGIWRERYSDYGTRPANADAEKVGTVLSGEPRRSVLTPQTAPIVWQA